MPEVSLVGELRCATTAEAERVVAHLPAHIERTLAEPGCLAFAVVRRGDEPLIWDVEERFVDAVALRTHQERVAASEWGRATSGIERRYRIEGLLL